jgi:hypothetical protein
MIRRWVASTLIVIHLLAGGAVMAGSKNILTLAWQWGGLAEHRILARVDRVEKEGGGLFGILRSPSMADSLPDARLVHASIVAGGEAGQEVVLRIPDRELPPTRAGDLLAVGYTADNRAICVERPPAGLAEDALQSWLGGWRCEPRP